MTVIDLIMIKHFFSFHQTGSKGPRRKSALIAQWESMIQQQAGNTIEEN
jgi:hypothetical protein